MNLGLRKIYYLLSPNFRLLVRRFYYLPSDIINFFLPKKGELMPPKGMIFTGSGDFLKVGESFLKNFIEYGNLKPDHSVLDIGSGIGRMAIPLSKHLSKKGKYEGFDIVKKGVKWCQRNISPKFPNFNFQHIDLKNSLYNLSTNEEASQFMFPYQDKSFDFIFLISVFTHMLPADVENYLKEINRVLKSSGTCFFTCFIIDDVSKNHLSRKTDFKFLFDKGNYSLMDEKVPEANVAYKSEYLHTLINTTGFKIKSTHKGYWFGRLKSDSLNFQDILILEKSN